MLNNAAKVQELGVTQDQITNEFNFSVEEFDDNIRSSRSGNGKPLSPSTQVVYDKLQLAIDYANSNGKAQISLSHTDYPIKGKMPNNDVKNAINSGKKKHSNISFSLIVDAINKEGIKLNSSVIQIKVKEEN
jgi:hypothetical protein